MDQIAAVIILNYNGADFLKKFLPQVVELTSSKTEVIVADNASTDDSQKILRENFPHIKTIVLDKNYGFAGGYNKALKGLDHQYFILLNSDVEVTKNWDIPLIQFLEENNQAAAVQPKVLSYSDREKFEYAGAAGGFIDKNYFPFCRGRIFGFLEEDTGQYDTPAEVFWATGACFAIRSHDYKNVGGLDEDFFAHMEEIDLCYRLKLSGRKIYCLPQSVVYHVGGGTLQMMSPFKTYLNYRNGLTLIVKNHFTTPLLPLLTRRLFLDGLSGVNFFVRGLPQHTWAILKAHFHFYVLLPNKLRKRRKIKSDVLNQKQSLVGIYKGNIIVDYFFRKKKKFSELMLG